MIGGLKELVIQNSNGNLPAPDGL